MTLAGLRVRWGLDLGAPFPNLLFNYAASVRRGDGTEAVLKLVFPGDKEFETEVAALRLFDGQGAVRLLEADPTQSAMLMERLLPGATLLTEMSDTKATGIIAELLPQLWRPVPECHPFPSVAGWFKAFDRLRRRYGGRTGPLPPGLVDRAEQLFRELNASMATVAVLHGDLHHANVLSAQRRPWLAIDPKGVIGEPAYDTAAMLRNPLPDLVSWPGAKWILVHRIDQLSEQLGLPRQRILGWGVAQTVLSAVWTLEGDGRGWEPAVACAELLAEID